MLLYYIDATYKVVQINVPLHIQRSISMLPTLWIFQCTERSPSFFIFNQCAKEVPISSFSISVPRRSLFPHFLSVCQGGPSFLTFYQCAQEVPLSSFPISVPRTSLFAHFLSVCQGGPSVFPHFLSVWCSESLFMRQKTDHSVKPRVSTKYPKDLCIFCPIIAGDHHTLPERNLNNLKKLAQANYRYSATREPWAWIFKRLRSPGIDSKNLIPQGNVAWRAGTTNRVDLLARKAT